MILHVAFRDCGVESRVQEDWYAIAFIGGAEQSMKVKTVMMTQWW